jgi:hypothetical protein
MPRLEVSRFPDWNVQSLRWRSLNLYRPRRLVLFKGAVYRLINIYFAAVPDQIISRRASMKAATLGAALLLAAATVQPVWAQNDLASATRGVVDLVQPVHIKAEIVGIDPGIRALTLQGPAGHTLSVMVSQQVAGFEQLKVGDRVDVLYKNALLVKADKVTGGNKGIRTRVGRSRCSPPCRKSTTRRDSSRCAAPRRPRPCRSDRTSI